jgi:hypothetical protein
MNMSGGQMNQRALITLLLIPVFVMISQGEVNGQTVTTTEGILKKNIEAIGGRGKLEEIKNFSFKAGSNTYFVRSDGTMKVLMGQEPVVIVAVLVTDDLVKENYFHQILTIEGIEKSRLQCMARLVSGLFSLANFEEFLTYQGVKSFGPEKNHLLSGKACGMDVTFSLDVDSFLVRRMVLEKYTAEEGHYGISYEFGDYKEINGIKIPSSIFYAPIGAQSSSTPFQREISDVKANLEFDDEFFSRIDVNIGEVTSAPGELRGNVFEIMSMAPRPSIIIVTNWRPQDIKKAGLRTGEKLILTLDNLEIELTFYQTDIEREDNNYGIPDARFMTMDPMRGNLYFIYLNLTDKDKTESIKAKLTPLIPIQIRRK